MPRLVIRRPNGEIEYAELTTEKSTAGTDTLEVYKDGSRYYAKLDSKIDTHMYVLKAGVRRYVQKKMVEPWSKKTVSEADGKPIPRSGWYQLRHTDGLGKTRLIYLKNGKYEVYLKQGDKIERSEYWSDREAIFTLRVGGEIIAELAYSGDSPDELDNEVDCTLYDDTDIEFIRL